MGNLEPNILVYGQWLLFWTSAALGLWGSGYLVWVSYQLGYQWYDWLERRRDIKRQQDRADQTHYEAVRRLELQALTAKQEMELLRFKAHNDSMNVALLQQAVDSGPAPSEGLNVLSIKPKSSG